MARQTKLIITGNVTPDADTDVIYVPKSPAAYTLAWWIVAGSGTFKPVWSPNEGGIWIPFYTELDFATEASDTKSNGVEVKGGTLVTMNVADASGLELHVALI